MKPVYFAMPVKWTWLLLAAIATFFLGLLIKAFFFSIIGFVASGYIAYDKIHFIYPGDTFRAY